jgi:hypothetical protein
MRPHRKTSACLRLFGAPLERVCASVRERVPRLDRDRYLAPDISAAAELVRSGALAAAVGVELPAVDGATQDLVSPLPAIEYWMMPLCPRVSTTPA